MTSPSESTELEQAVKAYLEAGGEKDYMVLGRRKADEMIAEAVREARLEEVQGLDDVWGSEWDCSHTPGHEGMSKYLQARLAELSDKGVGGEPDQTKS